MYASLLFLQQGKFFVSRGQAARLLPASLRPFSTSGRSSQADDEESVPEKFREDRALNIAQNSPQLKNDRLLQELLQKEHNISSLESFYNVNQKQMNLLHHSFLLYRVNQVYKEIKRKEAAGA